MEHASKGVRVLKKVIFRKEFQIFSLIAMQKFFIAFVFILISCNSNESKSTSPESKEEKTITKSSKPAIRLYHVASIFYKYMPDTNRSFKDPDDLRDYFFATSRSFQEFSDSLLDNASNKDSIVLARRQAGILFDDLMGVINMKGYRNWKRDNRSMGLLSAVSPFSRFISLQQRIDFFKTFPPEIQNNEIGKKTWKTFEEYSFDKNINLNFHEFDGIELTDPLNSKTSLKNIFEPSFKYYIVVFGASWCSPCRLEEKQLKYWFNDIDPSQIKIVGFSIDNNIARWKKYLENDKFQWNSYLLQGQMNNSMVKKLGFQGVPRNFLLDSTGNVITENTDIRNILKAIPILQTE